MNPLTADYPTATWGQESRDYHVCINVPPREIGDEMLAARVSLVEGEEPRAQALIKAIWTEDQQLSTRINREVAHYTGQAELAECIQEGLEARKEGDLGTATFKLGRAVQLATESGNDGTMKLLQAVVEVDDPATGTVRLKHEVKPLDEMSLDTRSTATVRVGPCGDMTVACPRGHESQATDYCDQCGAPIGAPPPTAGTTHVFPTVDEVDTSPAARREPCPVCGAPRSGDDRYCEGCGFDFHRPPPAAGAWEAVVTADRAQFERLAVAGISFPTDYTERRFVLADGENRIGRSRGNPDEAVPEIDLAAAPRRTPGSPACTRCSSGAATGSSSYATSGRRTARWSTTTRCRSPPRPRSRSATAIASASERGRRSRSTDASRGGRQKSCRASRPEPSTIATSWCRFSF